MLRTIAAALTVMTILLARPHQASAGYCAASSGGPTRIWDAPDMKSGSKLVGLKLFADDRILSDGFDGM